MRKIIVSMNVTLDGYMAAADHGLDWHFPCWNEEMGRAASEQLSRADTILLGGVTFRAMAAYWAHRPGRALAPREDIDFAEMMDHHTKIVFSRTLSAAGVSRLGWNNSMLFRGPLAAGIATLKRQTGRDMIVYGSGQIVKTLRRLGLIDEYRIWVHPVVLGQGRPLFEGLKDACNLVLRQIETFGSGVVLFTYDANG